MKIQATLRTTLALSLTSMLALAGAQSMTSMKDSGMKGGAMTATTIKHTTEPGMNMMMSGHTLMVMAAPGMGKYTYRTKGNAATYVYASKNSKALFHFYDQAIRGEGWHEDMGMKMGQVMAGEYVEAYQMKGSKLDLMSVTKGNSTTVTIQTH